MKGERVELKRGRGCANCRSTGYLGRSGIFEVLPITEPLKELTLQRADLGLMRKKAREEGLVSLRENAIQKMLEGITHYNEILRVTSGTF